MAELHYLTINEASGLIKSRRLSPMELTNACLDRIEAVDGTLKSYVTLLADSALEEARAAEAEISRGEYRGPLHGIPIALKDLYDTKGVRTTASSKVLEHRVPSEDATTTARLKGAGSILMGKLAMHEFALGGPPTSLFEPPHNPWNTELVTGGSSTGSGAAVAAGLCMGSLGSDTGGSIRMPASLCGVVGLKPTYGRVSRRGVIPLSWSLDHCGPLTRTVEDAAIMLQAIAGRDAKDPTSSTLPVPDYSLSLTGDVRGLTVGIPRQYLASISDRIDPEVQSAVEKALTRLEEMGAHLEEVEIPSLEYVGIANTVIMVSEAYSYHLGNLRSQLENFGEIIRTRFCMGALLTAGDYLQAQRARNRIKRECGAVFQKVDALAMPTSLRPAVDFETYDPMSIIMNPSFTSPWNSAGLPAVSIPCGFNGAGLPLGLQIVGKPFDEPTVLRVAYTYQQHARWYERRPPI